MNQFKAVLDRIPEDLQGVANGLVEELIYIRETIISLKADIEKKGPVEHFQNGKQNFFRESPALSAYTKILSKFAQLNKQLVDMMPKKAAEERMDMLEEFLNYHAEES